MPIKYFDIVKVFKPKADSLTDFARYLGNKRVYDPPISWYKGAGIAVIYY